MSNFSTADFYLKGQMINEHVNYRYMWYVLAHFKNPDFWSERHDHKEVERERACVYWPQSPDYFLGGLFTLDPWRDQLMADNDSCPAGDYRGRQYSHSSTIYCSTGVLRRVIVHRLLTPHPPPPEEQGHATTVYLAQSANTLIQRF